MTKPRVGLEFTPQLAEKSRQQTRLAPIIQASRLRLREGDLASIGRKRRPGLVIGAEPPVAGL